MRINRVLAIARMFLVALVVAPMFVSSARAQGVDTVYRGAFTLTQQINWGKNVLRPGHYTMTIASIGNPVVVKVENEDTGESFRVVTAAREETTAGASALFLQTKNGGATVQSLSLPQLRIVLIYKSGPAREQVLEAHAGQVVPILLARK